MSGRANEVMKINDDEDESAPKKKAVSLSERVNIVIEKALGLSERMYIIFRKLHLNALVSASTLLFQASGKTWYKKTSIWRRRRHP